VEIATVQRLTEPIDTSSREPTDGAVASTSSPTASERVTDGLRSPGPDDVTLLRRFVDGDREILGELAARHERDLLGLAQGLVGRSQAPDVVQETWVRVIRHAAGFKGNSDVRTWLWRITINRCRDLLDQQRRRIRRESRAVIAKIGIEPPTGAATRRSADAPAGADRERGDDEELIAALGRIAVEQRELVILCHHHGGGLAVAAEVLDIPVGTVKSRLHAARRALRDQLTKDDGR